MKKVRLIAASDDEFGGVGLLLADRRADGINPAQTGLVIAHDVLEHSVSREYGSIESEHLALGATWYFRGEYEDLSRDGTGSAHTAVQHLASDLARQFFSWIQDTAGISVPRTVRCDDCEDALQEIIAEASRLIEEQWRDELDQECHSSSEVRAGRRLFLRAALARLRLGYRAARRKYPDQSRANSLFWEIVRATDRYAQHADEGAEYVLSYDYATCRASCEEFYGDEDYR